MNTLIKPFKTISQIDNTNFKTNASVEIHYIPKYHIMYGSEVVIVHKYIINDFVTKGKPAFVKIVSIYGAKNFHSTDFEKDIKIKSIPITLRYSVITAYDGFNKFGHTIYNVDTYGCVSVMCVSDHDNNDEYNYWVKSAYSIDDVRKDRQNTIFPFVEENEDETYNIDKAYSGSDEINACVNLIVDSDLKKYVTLDTKVIVYPIDIQEKASTFSDTNLMNTSKRIFFGKENVIPVNQSEVNDLLCKMDVIRNLIGGINKAFIESMFDGITLIYRKGGINVMKIDYPLSKQIVSHVAYGIERFNIQMQKLAMYAEDLFGPIKIILKITEAYSYIFVRFEDENAYDDGRGICWFDLTGDNTIKDTIYRTEIMSRYFNTILKYIPDNPNDHYPFDYTGESMRIHDLISYFRGVLF